MSKAAIAALSISLFSWSIIAFIAAVLLSVMSLRRIRRSSGKLKGATLAVIALVIPIWPLGMWVCLHSSDSVRSVPAEEICRTNLSGIGKVLLMNIYGGEWTKAELGRWCDSLLSSEGESFIKVLQCPADRRLMTRHVYPFEAYLIHVVSKKKRNANGLCDYALNTALLRGPLDIDGVHPDMVIMYDSKPGWNSVGDKDDIVLDRHVDSESGGNVLFADYTVAYVAEKDLASLYWNNDDQSK